MLAGQLVIRLEDQVLQRLTVSQAVLTIGRTPDNDLVLVSSRVSRRHAELRSEKEHWLLTDLGSSNGTFVNGERLLPQQPRVLAGGEVVSIGPYAITYQVVPISEQADPGPVGDLVSAGRQPEPEEGVAAAAAGVEPVIQAMPMRPPRQTWPVVAAENSTVSSYLQYLPIIFQNDAFLGRFLKIFQSIWEPLEDRQDHIAMYFDPRTCPASFLPWLASWLDLGVNVHWPEGRLRRIVAEAMELYRWRGTRYGLTRMIEVCTGLTPEITQVSTHPFVFRIKLVLADGAGVERGLVEGLVKAHKPAHAAYVLEGM